MQIKNKYKNCKYLSKIETFVVIESNEFDKNNRGGGCCFAKQQPPPLLEDSCYLCPPHMNHPGAARFSALVTYVEAQTFRKLAVQIEVP